MYDEFEIDMPEDEIEEIMDSFILSIAEDCQKSDDVNAVLNIKRAKELIYVYNIMNFLARDENVEVTYKMNEPYKSMGSVSIVGNDLIFCNTELFAKAIKLASNFNVYPRTDGTVQIDLTFHEMTTPIG